MSVFENLFEEISMKAQDKRALGILLCDLTEKVGGCNACPAQKHCKDGIRGWDVLLVRNPDELWRR